MKKHTKSSNVVNLLLLVAACFTALPVEAGNKCSSVAGVHSGSFKVKAMGNFTSAPKSLEGTWNIKINGDCTVVGTVETGFFGTVDVKGDYGDDANALGSRPIGSKYDPSRLFFAYDGSQPYAKFFTFAFIGKDNFFVNINSNNPQFSFNGNYTNER